MSKKPPTRNELERRVVLAAIKWGAFQEHDSLLDQEGCDHSSLQLVFEHGIARQELIDAIEELVLCR